MPVGVVLPAVAASIAAPFESCETSQVGGNYQQGCYGEPAGTFTPGGPFDVLRVQHLPACTRVQLVSASNPSVISLGPQECKVILSLSGTNTVQLNPSYGDNLNAPSQGPISPAVPAFVFTSRQRLICTVSPSGLVQATGRGETIILCSSVRCANASIPGSAVPPAGLVGTEIACEVRVVVLA